MPAAVQFSCVWIRGVLEGARDDNHSRLHFRSKFEFGGANSIRNSFYGSLDYCWAGISWYIVIRRQGSSLPCCRVIKFKYISFAREEERHWKMSGSPGVRSPMRSPEKEKTAVAAGESLVSIITLFIVRYFIHCTLSLLFHSRCSSQLLTSCYLSKHTTKSLFLTTYLPFLPL